MNKPLYIKKIITYIYIYSSLADYLPYRTDTIGQISRQHSKTRGCLHTSSTLRPTPHSPLTSSTSNHLLSQVVNNGDLQPKQCPTHGRGLPASPRGSRLEGRWYERYDRSERRSQGLVQHPSCLNCTKKGIYL